MYVEMKEPRISSHGSISVAVNMRAIYDYMNAQGRSFSYMTSCEASPLDICVSCVGIPVDSMMLFFAAFQSGLDRLSANDILVIRDHIEDAVASRTSGDSDSGSDRRGPLLPSHLVVSLLSKVAWDPDALAQFQVPVASMTLQEETLEDTQHRSVCMDIQQVSAPETTFCIEKYVGLLSRYLPITYK